MTPISNLKEQLETIRFGILKASSTRLLGMTPSCIIKVREVDQEGNIWCSMPNNILANFLGRENFAAKLKFIQKSQGLFIKVHGQATIVSLQKSPTDNNSDRYPTNLLLRIKVQDAQYYQKKSLSVYTSVLQAINNFSIHQAHPARTDIVFS